MLKTSLIRDRESCCVSIYAINEDLWLKLTSTKKGRRMTMRIGETAWLARATSGAAPKADGAVLLRALGLAALSAALALAVTLGAKGGGSRPADVASSPKAGGKIEARLAAWSPAKPKSPE